jgi:hypothetical protein
LLLISKTDTEDCNQTFKRTGSAPLFPANVLGDFAAGSLSCAFGIVAALLERVKSGQGQVIDASIVDGSLYLGSFVYLVRSCGYSCGKTTFRCLFYDFVI